ncbi:putative RNA methyltransferase [Motiliproteus sp. SC1-56]|uniref:putative RNA methyltransferase n=1 Tax=Motiliproteus sp. SC1-56 TaxID=2799565 RepID=UPI001A8D809F|nr:methyltransferase domain-containing protein [Motiliproteus sp. SC1-56]
MTPSPLLRCPLCQQTLAAEAHSLRCPQGHGFDRARQGYFHLLPVQNKRSRTPGDDPDMVRARHSFLEQGHYAPLSDHINRLLLESLNPAPKPLRLLDCGCGEGYYTDRLQHTLNDNAPGSDLIGLDISKAAVRQAAKRNPAITWIVASSKSPPLAEHGLDGALCLFAPLESAALHRVLKPGGLLLVATTGPDHLLTLREAIYPEVRRNAFNPTPQLERHFSPVEQEQVQFDFTLEHSEAILQLLAMTPHQWRASAHARQNLANCQQLTIGVDVQLNLYQAR